LTPTRRDGSAATGDNARVAPPAARCMTNLTDALHIPDTQSARDNRHLLIQRVGVKDVRYPLTIMVAGVAQATAAQWDLDVALPAEAKGTHMSRFVAWLDALDAPIDAAAMPQHLARMLELLGAREGRIEARFSFFLRKRAPVSGVQSLLDYQGRWIAEARDGMSPARPSEGANSLSEGQGRRTKGAPLTSVWSEVGVPVKSLCPCSKEISDYGAHNQRSLVTIRLEQLQPIEWHEQVRFAEDAASSEIWPLLKRPDEKWVTERAYENPKFVEDLVRDVALRLNADKRVGRYSVDVENFESIHNHSAYARIERA
jgi:GTP cyclohydrolase IB